jgi:hypothetical protein
MFPRKQIEEYNMLLYEVIVSNIGAVHTGASLKDASAEFRDWVKISKSGKGKAGDEAVTLLRGGEPISEFQPTDLYCEAV